MQKLKIQVSRENGIGSSYLLALAFERWMAYGLELKKDEITLWLIALTDFPNELILLVLLSHEINTYMYIRKLKTESQLKVLR